jgi:hypothetical protein
MDAPPWKQGSARVPEMVPADRRETSTIRQRFEVPVDDLLRIARCSFTRGENELRIFV